MVKQTEKQFEDNGMSLEVAGLTREKLIEQNQDVAVKRVRGDFILKKIGETEEIQVAEEDMDRGFKRIGDMYNMSIAKVKEYFQSRDDLLPFMNELLNEKILRFLREKAVLVEAEEVEKNEQDEESKEDETAAKS
jgi:trigger factor